MKNEMSQEDAQDKYHAWRQRTTPCLREKFTKMFEHQSWQRGAEGWGRVSTCGKFIMIVAHKSIRLVEPNQAIRRTGTIE